MAKVDMTTMDKRRMTILTITSNLTPEDLMREIKCGSWAIVKFYFSLGILQGLPNGHTESAKGKPPDRQRMNTGQAQGRRGQPCLSSRRRSRKSN
jgi:hypothetical protein